MSAESVWWQHRGQPPTQPADPDPGQAGLDETFDTVVVGAGVTGLTTALALVRAGRSVLVVEARHPGAVTTGRTTGKVSALQGTTLSSLTSQHGSGGRRRLEAYVESSLAALDWVAAFCEETGVPAERRDAVTYAAAPEEVPTVRDEHEAAASLGLDVAWRGTPDLPVPSHAATVLADQLQLDPVALVLALLDQVRAGGGRLLTGRRVQRLRQRARDHEEDEHQKDDIDQRDGRFTLRFGFGKSAHLSAPQYRHLQGRHLAQFDQHIRQPLRIHIRPERDEQHGAFLGLGQG